MLRSFSLNRILVLFVTIGFAFFLVDTLLEHMDVLTKELASSIPVLYCVLGIVIGGLATARWHAPAIKLLRIYLIVGILVGAGGLYFHIHDDDDDEKEEGVRTTEPQRENGDQKEEKEKDKPPLAPLAFAGLSALGLIATSRTWKAEMWEQEEPTA